jgi:hypothetical protein
MPPIVILLSLFFLAGVRVGATTSNATMSISASPSVSIASTQLGSLGSTNCDSAVSIFENCEASTPGFANLCFHNQQSCLCSTAGTWAPSFFDNYWSSCLAWASTADPSQYSLLGPHTNGDVQSRKCQTWNAFTATGGIPSGCLTSPSNTLSSTSLAAARPSSVVPTGAAVEIAADMHVSLPCPFRWDISKRDITANYDTGWFMCGCHHHCCECVFLAVVLPVGSAIRR